MRGRLGANYPGHIGPFGLHDWTDRGQRSNGAFAAVPFIEYFECTGNQSWLRRVGPRIPLIPCKVKRESLSSLVPL